MTVWWHETFTGPALHPSLRWHREPEWQLLPGGDGLAVRPPEGTDYWRRTHYGFDVLNAPHLAAEVPGGFALTARVQVQARHRYDQAGLLVHVSDDSWIKTSLEFLPDGPSRLGAVVTNAGWSDWSTQDHAAGADLLLRVTRNDAGRDGDYRVEYATPPAADAAPAEWHQLRLAHLHDDDGIRPVRAGLYACSPQGSGATCHFRFLDLRAVHPTGHGQSSA